MACSRLSTICYCGRATKPRRIPTSAMHAGARLFSCLQPKGGMAMRRLSMLLSAAALGVLAAAPALAQEVVTIYAADGLRDGKPSWFDTQFDAFTKQTGIKVQYIESGSGEVVNRIEREKTNTQADVIVTLPPFMQKAAADGMLEAYNAPEASAI